MKQKKAPLLILLSLLAWCSAQADSEDAVTAANTLLSTSQAQTSPSSLASGYSVSQTLSLGNAEKWTNLPGTPPSDSVRVGPVIGGGPTSYGSYELSATVSSGQTDSPRSAALNLASATLSTFGYDTMYEIRNADDVLLSTGNSGYNFGDYRVAILGTPSASNPWMVKFAGHHLAYNLTFNGPYVSASPLFLGLEPPDYHSTGTDLTDSSSATAENAYVIGTNSGTANDFLVSYPYNSSKSSTVVHTGGAGNALPNRVNVSAVAIDGATDASYTIASAAESDNGFYFCEVMNGSGTTNSNTAVLTISLTANSNLYNATASTGSSPAPVITTQPASQTVTAGSSVTFTVAASSATGYQWYKIATTHRAALERHRAAVSNLATALQADSTLASSAKLSGTFNDVVMGVTNSGDTNFPFINTSTTYPTGTSGRGALYGSLTADQQATLKPLIKAMIEAWVTIASDDVSASLLQDYESDAALNATYVAYQVGAGAADGTGLTRCNFDSTINQEKTPTNSQHSYVRIDGPRCWVEMVVQNAIIYSSNGFVHYHSLYRDKLADYGNEFGGYLDTSSTSSTYTRAAISTPPASATIDSSTTNTFSVTATGTASLSYQWYKDGTAIPSATGSTYTTNVAGSYNVTVSNVYGTAISTAATLTVTGGLPSITTMTLPDGEPGTAYSAALAVSGGTPPYTWSIYSGTLPADLMLSTAGVISGTPTTEQDVSFTVQVDDSAGNTATQALSIHIAYATLAVTNTSLPGGSPGVAYSTALSATGGDGTYTWSFQNGDLPPGLTVLADGTLSGTPTASGTFSFTVLVQDGAGHSATGGLSLAISATAVGITTTSLPNGQVGTAYSAAIAASGGTASFSYAKASGTLPNGLTLGTTGTLAGTPTKAGKFTFTVRATDSAGSTAKYSYTVAISADGAPVLTAPTFPATIIGDSSFSYAVQATNSPTKYYATGLPAGLSIARSSGVISGRPSKAGTFTVKLSAANSSGTSNVVKGTLTVAALPTESVGSFVGLVDREPTVNSNLGGRLNLTTGSGGAFSGVLIQGSVRRSFTGKLAATVSSDPQVSAKITWPSLGQLTLVVTLNATDGTLTGTLSSASGSAAVSGWKSTVTTTATGGAPSGAPGGAGGPPSGGGQTGTTTSTTAGYYTVALDLASVADEGQAAIPQGIGSASITISSAGVAVVGGQTADGTAFTTTAPIGSAGQILIYTALYNGGGSIAGQLTLTSSSTVTDNSLAGTLTWLKGANSSRKYAAGFGPVSLTAAGKYMATKGSGSTVEGLPASSTTATLNFTEGGLASAATNPDTTFTYSSANKVTLSGTNPGKVTLTISKATGAFSGTFKLVDGGATRTANFNGHFIRLDSGNVIGAGYFLLPQIPGTGEQASTAPILSGEVTIEQ